MRASTTREKRKICRLSFMTARLQLVTKYKTGVLMDDNNSAACNADNLINHTINEVGDKIMTTIIVERIYILQMLKKKNIHNCIVYKLRYIE